ncbi:SAM pointed domain-containing Ets transcription factor-like isoform X2 [Brachyhypopomus gauderio]|uniref:SAM pointed domain-containing Ets transcription factor-like isoform X2 n=1 Tax=Brachyhypopomus gauderio TaxID=698409 RepID=UPI004040F894
MASSDRHHVYMDYPAFCHSQVVPWIAEEHAKVFPSPPSMPECRSRFDMFLAEDSAWLVQRAETATPPARDEDLPHCKEAGQCPVIDSGGRGPCPGTNGQVDVEDRCLEQVHTLVVEEVLKDIETACKLLNIPPDPVEWSSGHVQKWLLWTEHLYRLPQVGRAFQDLSGSNLCVMSEDEFRQRSSQCGDVLYAHLDIWKSAAWMKERCSPEAHCFIGIFKIEDSAHVAKLWGIRKNRPAMNYDKLSRSIRQYYKKGIIKKPDVSQRLVYQFVHPV